jgi:hypothetical protein
MVRQTKKPLSFSKNLHYTVKDIEAKPVETAKDRALNCELIINNKNLWDHKVSLNSWYSKNVQIKAKYGVI